jgi:adenine-specific DNA-methyltransferase
MSNIEITPNAIYKSDCLVLLERLSSNSAMLVYLDPPFFTEPSFLPKKRVSEKSGRAEFDNYLDWLSKVLSQALRITKSNGSIVIHTVPRINSYVRLISEELFGEIEFTEIVLRSPKRFHNNKKPIDEHETLLFCRKSTESIWNPPMRPLSAEEIEHRYNAKDEQGRRYAKTPLTQPIERSKLSFEWKGFQHQREILGDFL